MYFLSAARAYLPAKVSVHMIQGNLLFSKFSGYSEPHEQIFLDYSRKFRLILLMKFDNIKIFTAPFSNYQSFFAAATKKNPPDRVIIKRGFRKLFCCLDVF